MMFLQSMVCIVGIDVEIDRGHACSDHFREPRYRNLRSLLTPRCLGWPPFGNLLPLCGYSSRMTRIQANYRNGCQPVIQ